MSVAAAAARAGDPTLLLRGWAADAPREIYAAARAGKRPSAFEGDFVLAADAADGTSLVVSSVVSSLPYYYHLSRDGARFVHGADVFDVVRRAGIPWVWNPGALESMLILDHTMGEDTLHADVKRVPPCSVLVHDARGLDVRRDDFWSDVFRGGGSVEEALGALGSVLDEMDDQRAVVSLSGGLDSRLILSRFLARGRKPLCLTMGYRDSTDMLVARAIVKKYALPHRTVELDGEDYLRHAPQIVRATSGTKSAAHWHTFLYPRAAALPEGSVHLVGANGEFARSYYLDKGILSRLADVWPTDLARPYFTLKYESRHNPLRSLGLAQFPVRGASPVPAAGGGIARRAAELSGGGRFLDRLDRFYATNRVRHFIGNGMALYDAVSATRSPFLDVRWIRAAARLPRAAKLGGVFHRAGIAANCPGLLEFPAGGESRLSRTPPPLQWTKRSGWVGYSPSDSVLTAPRVEELLRDSSELDSLLEAPVRRRMVDLRLPRVNGVLLPLHFAVRAIRELGIEIA